MGRNQSRAPISGSPRSLRLAITLEGPPTPKLWNVWSRLDNSGCHIFRRFARTFRKEGTKAMATLVITYRIDSSLDYGARYASLVEQIRKCERHWEETTSFALVSTPETASQLADRLYFKRSEEHTSELKSLMRISYAVFGLQNKT